MTKPGHCVPGFFCAQQPPPSRPATSLQGRVTDTDRPRATTELDKKLNDRSAITGNQFTTVPIDNHCLSIHEQDKKLPCALKHGNSLITGTASTENSKTV